jgi:hypothetical protein
MHSMGIIDLIELYGTNNGLRSEWTRPLAMPPDRRIGLSQFASAALVDRKQSALASTVHLSEDSKLLLTIQHLAGIQ